LQALFRLFANPVCISTAFVRDMTAGIQLMTHAEFRVSRATAVPYALGMDESPEDSALMLRYRDGDVAAFETLYERHKDALYRYLLRLCQQRDAAEDVFQDAWGKIIKSRQNYRPTAKFSTFLYRVAHNCFIDHIPQQATHADSRRRAGQSTRSGRAARGTDRAQPGAAPTDGGVAEAT
jgi:hypothetical protein